MGDRDTVARARVGQLLRGKWRLDRLIGVGGMASVYAATHRNGMRGAVKMLHPELAAGGEARERFLREGYVANAVDHDGVVKVLDDDLTDEGTVFLVMELLIGASVDALATRSGGRLAVEEAVAVGDQLLDVLAAAHDKGIWHRDLKPENLFLTRAGRLKVLDFGIAKMKQASFEGNATTTGSVIGSPAFMAPEQALGRWKLVDARSDLFAVGASLFNLLTGRRIHGGETITEVLVAAATQPVAPVQSVDPSLPAALCAVLDRALAFDRDGRFADARTMHAAMRSAAGSGDLSRLLDLLEPTARLPEAATQPSAVPAAIAVPVPSPPPAVSLAHAAPALAAPLAPVAPTAAFPAGAAPMPLLHAAPPPVVDPTAYVAGPAASWNVPLPPAAQPGSASWISNGGHAVPAMATGPSLRAARAGSSHAMAIVFGVVVAAIVVAAGGAMLFLRSAPASGAPTAAPAAAAPPSTSGSPESESEPEPEPSTTTAAGGAPSATASSAPTVAAPPRPVGGMPTPPRTPPKPSASGKVFKDW
jgi:eukaryotic-like serine/threonine-protein kinase